MLEWGREGCVDGELCMVDGDKWVEVEYVKEWEGV